MVPRLCELRRPWSRNLRSGQAAVQHTLSPWEEQCSGWRGPPMINSLEGSVSLAQRYFSCPWVFLSVPVKNRNPDNNWYLAIFQSIMYLLYFTWIIQLILIVTLWKDCFVCILQKRTLKCQEGPFPGSHVWWGGVVWLQSPLVLVALCSLQEVVFFGPCPFTTRLVLFLGENTS